MGHTTRAVVEALPVPTDDSLLTKYTSVARLVGHDCGPGSLKLSNLYAEAVVFAGIHVFEGATYVGRALYGYSPDQFNNDTAGDRSVQYFYLDSDVTVQGSAACQLDLTYHLTLKKGWNTVTFRRVHLYGDASTSLGYDVDSGVNVGDNWMYFKAR